jgi:hypothetical protein
MTGPRGHLVLALAGIQQLLQWVCNTELVLSKWHQRAKGIVQVKTATSACNFELVATSYVLRI